MNIQEAKSIRIIDFLAVFGHTPVKQRGSSVWYKSPFRMEKEASFKVDLHKNLWYDFGLGKGGDIITLALEIYQTHDISYALQCIGNKRRAFKPISISYPVEEIQPTFKDLKVNPLTNLLLLAYLKERKIDMELAQKVCKEVYFKQNGKKYFAIAFPNISGGYEVRNRYFKGCIAPKAITYISHEPKSEGCYLFEGFIDYLSFKPAFPFLKDGDCIVLNSVSNLQKAFPYLSLYKDIYCCLDNDNSGKVAVQTLKQKYGLHVHDLSYTYSQYKDLNEYLCQRDNEPLSK